jgi:DNA-binding transcriptional LysR family regulator
MIIKLVYDNAMKPTPKTVIRQKLADIGLPDLRALVATIDSGSFSAAADTLGVTQPSISMRIAALESRLGLRLIERQSPPSPTAAGREIFAAARRILAQIEEIQLSADAFANLRRGRLRLGFSTPLLAMPLIAAFRQRYPGIDIACTAGNTSELLDRLNRNSDDIVIASFTEPPSRYRAERIATHQPALLLPDSHPFCRLKTLGARQLVQLPLVAREAGSMTRALFDASMKSMGVAPQISLVLPTREAVREAARAGLGAGMVLTGDIGLEHGLVLRPIRASRASAGVYVVALADSRGMPQVDAFFSHLPDTRFKHPESDPHDELLP